MLGSENIQVSYLVYSSKLAANANNVAKTKEEFVSQQNVETPLIKGLV